jgi:hypothetical protein
MVSAITLKWLSAIAEMRTQAFQRSHMGMAEADKYRDRGVDVRGHGRVSDCA